MKIEIATPNGDAGEVVLDTHDGVPSIRLTIGGAVVTRRLTHTEVNEIRRWTELAYSRGQER